MYSEVLQVLHMNHVSLGFLVFLVVVEYTLHIWAYFFSVKGNYVVLQSSTGFSLLDGASVAVAAHCIHIHATPSPHHYLQY